MTHDQLTSLAARRGRGRLYDSAATLRLSNRLCTRPIDPQTDVMITVTLTTGWEHILAPKRLMKRLDQYISCCVESVPN